MKGAKIGTPGSAEILAAARTPATPRTPAAAGMKATAGRPTTYNTRDTTTAGRPATVRTSRTKGTPAIAVMPTAAMPKAAESKKQQ
jgi:hypothetical protein